MKTIAIRFILIIVFLLTLLAFSKCAYDEVHKKGKTIITDTRHAIDSVNDFWERRIEDTIMANKKRLESSIKVNRHNDSINSVVISKTIKERNYYKQKYSENKTIDNCDSLVRLDSALLVQKDTAIYYKDRQLNDCKSLNSENNKQIDLLENAISRKNSDLKKYISDVNVLQNQLNKEVERQNSWWNKKKTKLALITGFVVGSISTYYILR